MRTFIEYPKNEISMYSIMPFDATMRNSICLKDWDQRGVQRKVRKAMRKQHFITFHRFYSK